MKYVVTGGAGFIGSHIAEALAGSHEVVILDNFSSGKPENTNTFPGNVRVIHGSVTDLPLLKKVFDGADGIFHHAAIASVPFSLKDPVTSNDTNLNGTLNVLVAGRDCGVRKVVFASSASIYGNDPVLPKREDMHPCPLSPYAVSKLAGEYYMNVFSEIYDIETITLRYFNVFGPRQDPNSQYAAVIPRFITCILEHQSPVIFGDGKQTRDFTYVKDIAIANIQAMESSARGIFNVAYSQRMDLLELADTIMNITGITVPLVFEPPQPGDVRDSVADITRAREAFGYAPRYTMKAGLEETVEWYRMCRNR